MRIARTFACVALAVAAATTAFADGDAPTKHPDPLDALQAEMKAQDELVVQGKADKAVADARERAKTDGGPDALYLLGRALGNLAFQRAQQQAIEREAGKKRGPDDPPPEIRFDADSNRLLDEARENFERSSEAGGLVYAPAHLGLSRVARAKGDPDGAVEELKQALRIAPNFKGAAIELARSYEEKDQLGQAEVTLRAFLEQRPSDADAHVLLGIFLRHPERRRYAEAEAEFRAVVAADPSNVGARRLLAKVLMDEEKFPESAEHWEMARSADPKDDQSYMALFSIYHKLNKKAEALDVLNGAVKQLPGTELARRAQSILDQLKRNPAAWDAKEPQDPDTTERETLIKRLESTDHAVVQKALEDMRAIEWPELPSAVYRMVLRENTTAGERTAAVRLIADRANPQTLTILEIMLSHPKERENDAGVRKEVARAVSLLPTDAVVPVLFATLTDPDADVRDWSVRGIAARTGKWFRADLDVRTPDKDWPAELELYRKWWTSSSASAAKRSATLALAAIYDPVSHDSKSRVAQYALPAMDDPVESTWRAGYDLFRSMTFHSFGSETGAVPADERRRIADEARQWLDEQMQKAK